MTLSILDYYFLTLNVSTHFVVSRHENQENTIIKAPNIRLKKKKTLHNPLNSLFLGWHAVNKHVSTDFSSAATEKKHLFFSWHILCTSEVYLSEIQWHFPKIPFKIKNNHSWSHSLKYSEIYLCTGWQKQWVEPLNSGTLSTILEGHLHADTELLRFRTPFLVTLYYIYTLICTQISPT